MSEGQQKPVSLIVACGRDGVIGRGNALPWRLPQDLQYFKCTTLGKPIIMGRKTFESIGRPLPGRPNIVVTRQQDWRACESVYRADSLESAVRKACDLAPEAEEIMVIGGAQLYRAALVSADRIYKTEIDVEVDGGDAFFPALPGGLWREVSRQEGEVDAPLPHAFVVLERVEKDRTNNV